MNMATPQQFGTALGQAWNLTPQEAGPAQQGFGIWSNQLAAQRAGQMRELKKQMGAGVPGQPVQGQPIQQHQYVAAPQQQIGQQTSPWQQASNQTANLMKLWSGSNG